MKFYEKIFPKDVEIFLFTTDKYFGKEKENYQQRYDKDLKRTKIHYGHYNPLTLPIQLRRFCKKNKIDRVMNVGSHFNSIFFLFATLFTKSDYFVNILSDMFNQYKLAENSFASFKALSDIILTIPLVIFSKRATFTDKLNSKRAPYIFLKSKHYVDYLAAPLNASLFQIKNKMLARRKLGLSPDKKIIIYVGRVTFSRGSDFLKKLIKTHPEYYFIIIGRMMDIDFVKDKNLTCFEKERYELISMKTSEELVDYYNAVDLGLCVNREGAGPGLIAEEALACGTSIMISKLFQLKESDAIIQVPLDAKKIENSLRKYFSLPKKEKERLRDVGRRYILENYSEDVWIKKYISSYLGHYSSKNTIPLNI